ncbi:helix-turn-helix domain-containing protein [Candidatus Spongiihabitans sp.]|uniref:helix-turn-helix domain-containing protein n=1 Tax=Candidatus Spongiihabitans sp. TaxID=3101308 RepID=UPI003C7991C2
MTSKNAQERLKILGFFADHGEAATGDAFGLSRRTLYRWKQTLRQANGNPPS